MEGEPPSTPSPPQPPKPHQPEGFHAKQLVGPGLDPVSVPAFHLHTRVMLSIPQTHTCIPLIHLILDGQPSWTAAWLLFCFSPWTLSLGPAPSSMPCSPQARLVLHLHLAPQDPAWEEWAGVETWTPTPPTSSPTPGCLSFSLAQLESESFPHGGSTNPATADALC